MMTASHPSPFVLHASIEHVDTSCDEAQPVHEDISDGLMWCRKSQGWFSPSYTRKDCRCGFCSIGDPEPCPYARPASAHSLTSMLTAGRRSLTRLLSLREADKATGKGA